MAITDFFSSKEWERCGWNNTRLREREMRYLRNSGREPLWGKEYLGI